MREIWIVDDDEFYLNYLSLYLNATGYQTRTFRDGSECIRHINERPWAIVLDHHLGAELNGTDVLRIIKEHDPNIPIITISGSNRAEIAAEAFRGGSADYIQKDSASLLRLKVMLDRLKIKEEHNSARQRNRRRVYRIAILLIVIIIIAVTVLIIGS